MKLLGFLFCLLSLFDPLLMIFPFMFNAVFVPGVNDFHSGDRFWNHGLCSTRQGNHKPKIEMLFFTSIYTKYEVAS